MSYLKRTTRRGISRGIRALRAQIRRRRGRRGY